MNKIGQLQGVSNADSKRLPTGGMKLFQVVGFLFAFVGLLFFGYFNSYFSEHYKIVDLDLSIYSWNKITSNIVFLPPKTGYYALSFGLCPIIFLVLVKPKFVMAMKWVVFCVAVVSLLLSYIYNIEFKHELFFSLGPSLFVYGLGLCVQPFGLGWREEREYQSPIVFLKLGLIRLLYVLTPLIYGLAVFDKTDYLMAFILGGAVSLIYSLRQGEMPSLTK